MKETYRRLQAAKTWPETEALAGKLAALAGARGAADVKTLAGKVAQACRAAMRDTDFEHGGRSRYNKALERLRAAVAAGIDAARVNRALLAATAWASEVTEHWE